MKYLGLFMPDSGVQVVPCCRYSTEKKGAKVISRQSWYGHSHLATGRICTK